MHFIDWLVVAGYFAVLVGIVWWSSRKQETTADYFLAGRNVGWFAVGCSIFASNIGSEHIVGLAGNGATTGMAMAHWELHAWVLITLSWIFVPFYYRSGVFTMPEFLERRFDARSRWVLSVVSLVAYVLSKVSVTVYAGAVVFQALLPDVFGSPENAFWVGAFTTVILTGIYTALGGMRAVVYTEVVQAVLLLVGSVSITLFGLWKLGGWGELQEVCRVHADQFALWRPLSDPEFPWLGVMIASPIIGIWYWCTDQYIVQRTLAARGLRDARRGAIWGGFLKLTPVLFFLIPGLIGFALHERSLIQIPTQMKNGVQVIHGDAVFPTLVAELLPVGLRGVVVGGLLAALMSSLASLFNSCATLFTVDIYEKLRPGATEKELVAVGRMATGVVVVLGILWIPVMPMISQGGLYQYLQSVQGYLAPPITAVFLLGLFFRRINAAGALAGLVTGFVLGMVKLVFQALAGAGMFSEGSWAAWFGGINFLYFSGSLFALSVAVVLAVSWATSPPEASRLAGLTYGSLTPEQARENRESWGWPEVVGSAVVLGGVLAVYAYFTVWLN
jgi:SSS family solute:Na+ symporter